MDITDLKNRELINFLLNRRNVLQKDLAQKIYKKLDKSYDPHSLSGKISRNAVKLEEFQAACKILGYRLILEEIKEK